MKKVLLPKGIRSFLHDEKFVAVVLLWTSQIGTSAMDVVKADILLEKRALGGQKFTRRLENSAVLVRKSASTAENR